MTHLARSSTSTTLESTFLWIQPQNPSPVPTPESSIPPQPPNPACDEKLKQIFGGRGAVAAGSGYEPSGVNRGSDFRPHVYRTLHLYPSGNGTQPASGPVELFAPAGGGRPFSRESVAPGDASYGIHYNQLGNARDVTLVLSHVADYTNPRGRITSRTQIGNIGGPGGAGQNYLHSHLAILNSQGRNLSFVDVFCK